MASIRRTQSPAYHDRSYLINSFSLPSTTSPSPKHFSSSQSPISRFLSSISLQKPSRKPNQPWKWSIYKFLICFSLGFVLGLSPFFHNLSNNGTNDSAAAAAAIIIKPHQTNVEKIVFETVSLGLIQDSPPPPPPPLQPLPQPNKQLIVITPTYNRALQAYYLNRLAQALLLVPSPVLWIVVEMNSAETETAEILRRSGVMYRHLVCGKNSTNVKDRGVHQRNTALEHIERHRLDGIVYFADDDNVYEVDLFQSLRDISRFGTWPVAMLAQSKAKTILEGPICNGSQVIGWHTNEKSKRLRRFHVDMSGFAFNSTILWDPKRWNRTTSNPIRQLDTVKEGFQETTFIEQVADDEFQMEAIPYGCSRVMNWHLHLDAHNLVYPRGWLLQKNLNVVLPLE